MKYNFILVACLVSIFVHQTVSLSISDAYANSGRNINVDQEQPLPEKDESELEPELDPELDPEFDHDAEYGDEEGDASSVISSPSPTTSTTISTTSTTTVKPGPVKSKWNNKRVSKPHKKPLITSTGVKHLEKQAISKTKEHEKQITSSGLAPPSPVYEPANNGPTSSEEKSTVGDEKIKDSDRKTSEPSDDASEKDNTPTGWPNGGKLTKEEALSVNRIGEAAANGPFGNNRPLFNPSGLSNQLPWGIANFKLAGANDNNNNYDGFPSLAAKMAAYPQLFENSETSPTSEHQESGKKSGFEGRSPFGDNNNQSPYGYPPYGYNPSANPAPSYSPYNRMTSYPAPPPPPTSNSGSPTWGAPSASSLEMVESLLKNFGSNNSPWSGGASAGGGYGSYPPYSNYPSSSPPPEYNGGYPSQNPYSNNMYGATLNLPWGGESSQAWGQQDPQSAYKSWGGYNPQRTGPYGTGGSLSSYNNALAIQQLLGGAGGMAGGKVDGNHASDNPDASGTASAGEAFGTKSEPPSTPSSATFGPGYKNMYNNKQSPGGYYLPPFGSGFNSRQGIYSGQDTSAYDGGFPYSQPQSYGGGSGIGGGGYNAYLEYIKQAVAYAAQNRRRSNPYAQSMGMWGGDNSRGYGGYPGLGYPPSSSYQQPQMPWWASQTNYGNYRR